jgi:hypothetical protein
VFTSPWNTAAPYYNDGGFNATTGVSTVPASGIYEIDATIPYSTYTNNSISGPIPGFVVMLNGTTTILRGDMPCYYNGVARYTVVDSTVTMTGQVFLNAGDQITLRYLADGSSSAYDFGPTAARPAIWSMRRLV